MTESDKTMTVTLRVQVPTFSPEDAATKYLPLLIAAVRDISVPPGRPSLRIKGMTIGSSR